MPAKKEDKNKTTNNTSPRLEVSEETKIKKVDPIIKVTNKSDEVLIEKLSTEKKEPLVEKEAEEIFDMPDVDIEKEIEKATREGDKSKFIETVGRRKTASARIRLFTQGKRGIIVNGKPYTEFFTVTELQKTVEDPMEKLKCLDKFGVTVIVHGGGRSGQAEAIRHGIARALVKLNPYFKKRLKKFGFLTRDSRMRERKKPGLKRARRAPQWSKR